MYRFLVFYASIDANTCLVASYRPFAMSAFVPQKGDFVRDSGSGAVSLVVVMDGQLGLYRERVFSPMHAAIELVHRVRQGDIIYWGNNPYVVLRVRDTEDCEYLEVVLQSKQNENVVIHWSEYMHVLNDRAGPDFTEYRPRKAL